MDKMRDNMHQVDGSWTPFLFQFFLSFLFLYIFTFKIKLITQTRRPILVPILLQRVQNRWRLTLCNTIGRHLAKHACGSGVGAPHGRCCRGTPVRSSVPSTLHNRQFLTLLSCGSHFILYHFTRGFRCCHRIRS